MQLQFSVYFWVKYLFKKVFLFKNVLFLCMCVPTCMYIVCIQVSTKTRRMCCIPCNWSYRWPVWVLGSKSGSCEKAAYALNQWVNFSDFKLIFNESKFPWECLKSHSNTCIYCFLVLEIRLDVCHVLNFFVI